MKSIVVAYDQNRGIGADNGLPWHRDLPADLAHFKHLTTEKSVVMGRKTYESIGRPLPNRQNIVVSRSGFTADAVESAGSLTEAYQLAKQPICIIGGGEIYTQALQDADTIYATEVHSSFPAVTVYFPELDAAWQEVARERHQADDRNLYAYDFVTYQRG